MLITNIFFGIILIALGILGLKYNYRVTNSFSRYNWFEQNLGAGSSYLVAQAIAVLVVLFGIFTIFGIGDDVVKFIFSPITNLLRI